MTPEEYKAQFSTDDAVGWQCIDKVFEQLYPGQEPQHYAPPVHYTLGGEDPLDGISIYESKKQEDHYHFVSYGLSELYYEEESVGGEFSKWGFELTFRLKPFPEDKGEPGWVLMLMQNLARYVFNSKRWFEEYHFIPANGPIRLNTETDITALAFITDPEAGMIDTPHGAVTFLQMVGLTSAEYEQLQQNPQTTETKKLLDKLKEQNPLLITDLMRK